MYCQKCGAENLENATMCQSCGGVFVFSKPARTSGMAITSMILGISGFSLLGVFGITGIIGLVFGIIALGRIGKSGDQLKGKGFAITGITTSAVGLALWLTVFGVLLFVNSATTFSLSKKLKMHGDITASVPIGQKPGIEGLVCILNDKANPNDQCTAVLFVPEQVAVDYFLTCGPKGKEPVKLSWQFSGKKEKADRYNFAVTVPVGENATSTSKKTIVYDGKEQVIFEDAQRKIYIRPKE